MIEIRELTVEEQEELREIILRRMGLDVSTQVANARYVPEQDKVFFACVLTEKIGELQKVDMSKPRLDENGNPILDPETGEPIMGQPVFDENGQPVMEPKYQDFCHSFIAPNWELYRKQGTPLDARPILHIYRTDEPTKADALKALL